MSDADILRKKKLVQEKVWLLLSKTQKHITQNIATAFPDFPLANFKPGKISKGENYQDLPYMVLDYPAKLTQEDILAFRTMFYWGNFYSATMHLQGRSLEKNRRQLVENLEDLISLNCFISTNSTPWHYHYLSSNYARLSAEHAEKFSKDPFIKLSLQFNLDQYETLPASVTQFYLSLIKIIRYR